jgi:hypothetical protein
MKTCLSFGWWHFCPLAPLLHASPQLLTLAQSNPGFPSLFLSYVMT